LPGDLFDLSDRHHAGGKSTFAMQQGVVGDALFVGDRQEHRLWLSRHWCTMLRWVPSYVLWCGMNPSTARHDMDDLTVRKEQEFTARLGHSKMFKVNAGSYCCTNPLLLLQDGIQLAHPDNLPTIRRLAAEASAIVMATGHPPAPLVPLAREVFDQMHRDGRQMLCLGTTAGGWPKHSSRLAYATRFEEFKP
jgi:hypothetical protein